MAALSILTDFEPFLAVPILTPLVGINALIRGTVKHQKSYYGEYKDMASKRVSGTYIINSLSPEPFKSFIPHPLPPDPPLNLTGEHYNLLDKATLALGRLDGLTWQLPRDIVS